MDRCEKLRDNLYGVKLLTGSITPVKEHIALIFYIVNNTDNREAMQEKYFVPTDFYLIYDDEEMYRQVMGMSE